MFTGQLGEAQFGSFVLGGAPSAPTVVVPDLTGRAENTDTASHAEAQPVVLKLT